MATATTIVLIAVLVACLLALPFGLPGLWVMALVTIVAAVLGLVGWGTVTAAILVAGAAEAIEFLLVKRLGQSFGGSRKAFWGALIGGLVGLFAGVPVPIIGPIVTAFAGTFIGAAAVTFLETRSLLAAGKVGTGTLIGRVLAVATKIGAGAFVVILVWLRLTAL